MTEMEQVRDWRERSLRNELTEDDFVEIAKYLRAKHQIEIPQQKKAMKAKTEIDLDDLSF